MYGSVPIPEQVGPLTIAIREGLSGIYSTLLMTVPCQTREHEMFPTYLAACEARREDIGRAHRHYNDMFSPDSRHNIAELYSKDYARQLKDFFMPYLSTLIHAAEDVGAEHLGEHIEELVDGCEKSLCAELQDDLSFGSNYYPLYNMEHFISLTTIDKFDYRINTNGLLGLFEELLTDNVQYSYSGGTEALLEMDADVEMRAATFTERAKEAFGRYCARIVAHVSLLEKKLPTMEDLLRVREGA